MSAAIKRLSWPEYLSEERRSSVKHEFFQGDILAMAGATRKHNVIANNIGAELRAALKNRPCEVYPSDMRVRCPNSLAAYPDVSVACDPLFEDDREDTLLNPALIVEVLSPSTEAWDRGKKFESYRTISSLREFLFVSQTHPLVEHYVRQSAFDQWLLNSHGDLADVLTLPTLGIKLSLAEVYARVNFSDPDADSLQPPGDAEPR